MSALPFTPFARPSRRLRCRRAEFREQRGLPVGDLVDIADRHPGVVLGEQPVVVVDDGTRVGIMAPSGCLYTLSSAGLREQCGVGPGEAELGGRAGEPGRYAAGGRNRRLLDAGATQGSAELLGRRVLFEHSLSRAVIDAFKVFASGLPEVLHVFVLSGGDDFLLVSNTAPARLPTRD